MCLCCRWVQAPLTSHDSHVRSYISRFTCSDATGGRKKKSPAGENETERSRLPSLQGQPAATVNEPLQSMSQQSTESLSIPNMSYIMQPSNPRLKHTVARNNKASIMGGSWLSHPRCPQKLVYFWLFFFFFFFYYCFRLCSSSKGTLLALSVCVYPCRQTSSFIKGAMERTVCHGGPSSTVPNCFRGWMSHGRQIRVGGIWEGSSIALGQRC